MGRDLGDIHQKTTESGDQDTESRIGFVPREMPLWNERGQLPWLYIKQGMVATKEQRVQQLRGIARPTTVQDLHKALGAFAYVQRCLPGLAEVYKSLYNATTGKPYSRLVWTEQMITDFEKIKQMISDAVSLSLPDMEKRFTLVTDCSNIAAGAMLAQESQ